MRALTVSTAASHAPGVTSPVAPPTPHGWISPSVAFAVAQGRTGAPAPSNHKPGNIELPGAAPDPRSASTLGNPAPSCSTRSARPWRARSHSAKRSLAANEPAVLATRRFARPQARRPERSAFSSNQDWRHARECGRPSFRRAAIGRWIPAFAGMTRGGFDDSNTKQSALSV